jgi:catechol 2,3-dioxygenase-like lactoylglutathione lyase family enzyme
VFDHVTIRASADAPTERFYATVLPTLGIVEPHRSDFGVEWDDFSIGVGGPITRGLHVGLVARSREHVQAFWEAGTAAGYRDDGAPGPRPQYREDYYGAFLLDPDGNNVELVDHDR